jgi:hypothetical protein
MLVLGEMRQAHTTQHIRSLGELDVFVVDDLDAVAPGMESLLPRSSNLKRRP